MGARVEVFYSFQSDYCYFLLDRLIGLAVQGIEAIIHPVLRGAIRLPERYWDRDEMEQAYFATGTARMLWDGSTPGWDKGHHLSQAMATADLKMDESLASSSWDEAKADLDRNAAAMLDTGHGGVPLMVYRDEPFYGQGRFDKLIWRIRLRGDLPC